MNVSRYVGYIPQIEEWIKAAKLDALVLGLGPTAWLTRYLRRDLIAPLRVFGAHDACRILTVNDLVVMDAPCGPLNPDSDRHTWTVNGRPDRLWMFTRWIPKWDPYIHACMRPVMKPVNFLDWDVSDPATTTQSDFRLGERQPHTMFVSPTGTTTLAWHAGCRRIGVLGMDMMPGHHHTADNRIYLNKVDAFMCKIAAEAAKKGGAILNLSPVTSMQMFASGSLARIAQPCAAPA